MVKCVPLTNTPQTGNVPVSPLVFRQRVTAKVVDYIVHNMMQTVVSVRVSLVDLACLERHVLSFLLEIMEFME